jgi:hypothetical protein
LSTKLLYWVATIIFLAIDKGKNGITKSVLVLSLCLVAACAAEKQVINDTPQGQAAQDKENKLLEIRQS